MQNEPKTNEIKTNKQNYGVQGVARKVQQRFKNGIRRT